VDNAHRTYRTFLGNANPGYNNPLWTLYEQATPSAVDRFIISSDITINPMPWLTVIARGGVDTFTDRRETFFAINSAGSSGELETEEIRNREVNFDGIVKARKELTNIGLDLTVGYNVNDRQRTADYVFAQNALIDTDLRNQQNYTAFEPENSKRFIRSNRLYFLGGIDLFDQVFVNLSGVNERASTIKGSFFYPSADVAWQFTQLEALKNNTILSFGKLRAGFGQVGVQPLAHKFQTTFETFSYNAYDDGLNGLFFGGVFRLNDDQGNPDLKPEIKTELEIGADLRMFRDKLSLGLTYYTNEIKDILFDVALPRSGGFNNIYTNAGTMENKGVEVEFDYNLFSNQNWRFNIFGNYNDNKNKVTSLSGTS
ncbi:MAG: TonB-dependent receptor, partial [Cyclobacteriaceae bacterium]